MEDDTKEIDLDQSVSMGGSRSAKDTTPLGFYREPSGQRYPDSRRAAAGMPAPLSSATPYGSQVPARKPVPPPLGILRPILMDSHTPYAHLQNQPLAPKRYPIESEMPVAQASQSFQATSNQNFSLPFSASGVPRMIETDRSFGAAEYSSLAQEAHNSIYRPVHGHVRVATRSQRKSDPSTTPKSDDKDETMPDFAHQPKSSEEAIVAGFSHSQSATIAPLQRLEKPFRHCKDDATTLQSLLRPAQSRVPDSSTSASFPTYSNHKTAPPTLQRPVRTDWSDETPRPSTRGKSFDTSAKISRSPRPQTPSPERIDFINPRPALKQRYVSAGEGPKPHEREEIAGPEFVAPVISGSSILKDELFAKLDDPDFVRQAFGEAGLLAMAPRSSVEAGETSPHSPSKRNSPKRGSGQRLSGRDSGRDSYDSMSYNGERRRKGSSASAKFKQLKSVFSRKSSSDDPE